MPITIPAPAPQGLHAPKMNSDTAGASAQANSDILAYAPKLDFLTFEYKKVPAMMGRMLSGFLPKNAKPTIRKNAPKLAPPTLALLNFSTAQEISPTIPTDNRPPPRPPIASASTSVVSFSVDVITVTSPLKAPAPPTTMPVTMQIAEKAKKKHKNNF